MMCVVASGAGPVVTSPLALLSFDAEVAKDRPVTKVVTLLKDMLKELEAEAEQDEEIYDKMACWCETNEKDLTKRVKDAKADIEWMKVKIDELGDLSVRLGLELTVHAEELSKFKASLDEATLIRMKELAEFQEQEKDLILSIKSLKDAIIVLKKHHPDSVHPDLLQATNDAMLGVAATLGKEIRAHAELLEGVLTHAQQRAVTAFVDDGPRGFKSYNPQSGEILGILEQMKEKFEKNLGDIQETEVEKANMYEGVKISIEKESSSTKIKHDRKTQQLADIDLEVGELGTNLEDISITLVMDEKYLIALKAQCAALDKEWAIRQKMRQKEMEAVSKALAYLTSDDAMELFSRTFNPSMLQREGTGNRRLRLLASEVLRKAGQDLGSPKLAALAYQVRLDAFTKVKAAIDALIAELTKEQADEVKHKDFCVEELNTNQLQTEKKERERKTLEATIEDLKMTIEKLTKEIKELKDEIAEMELQKKKAADDREAEHKDFLLVEADQKATIKLLSVALTVLKKVYEDGSFAQQPTETRTETKVSVKITIKASSGAPPPPPPPGFEPYGANRKGGGVLDMIEKIVSDAKQMLAEAIKDEDDAQAAYENFVGDTNRSIETKTKEIVNNSDFKAKSEIELSTSEKELDAVQFDLEKLADYSAEVHKSCDFLMKHFEYRQNARGSEIEALKQAKQILSGANFKSMLQSGRILD